MKNYLMILFGLLLFQFNSHSQVIIQFALDSNAEQDVSITELKINEHWVKACCTHFDLKGAFKCKDGCDSDNVLTGSPDNLTQYMLLSEQIFQGIKWSRLDESKESENHVYEYKNGQLNADHELLNSLENGITAMEIELRDMNGLYVRIGKAE